MLVKGVSHTTEEGEKFAVKLMKYLRKACDTWKKETHLGFALYGTPAESLCYRFARIDKERFGSIKDVTDKGFYTNSYHVDVREKIDAFEKLKCQRKELLETLGLPLDITRWGIVEFTPDLYDGVLCFY